MDLQRALADGEQFIKNAQDEMERKILREDQLYFIENQVEAIDTYLSDSEDVAPQSAELKDVRDRLRALKQQLEKKSMEFLAQQEGQDLPEDLPPEETASDLVDVGREFVEMADQALKTKVSKIAQVSAWEDPLTMLNSFLADSETFVPLNKDLGAIRASLKTRKAELQKRIADVVSAWRAADAAGDADDDDE